MTVTRYLTRRVLTATGVALLILFALTLLLDLADNANELAPSDTGDSVLWAYTRAAYPVVLGGALPAAILIGTMAAFAQLARNNEITSLYSAGLGLHSLILRLLPATALLGLAYFLIQFLLAPPAEVAAAAILKANAPPPPAPAEQDTSDLFWLRSGDLFLAFADASLDGRTLKTVTLYERGQRATLRRRVTAATAAFTGSGWTLTQAQETDFNHSRAIERTDQTIALASGPPPAIIQRMVSGAKLTGLEATREDALVAWGGRLSPAFIETRRQQAFAAPVTALIMVMAASLLANGSARHPTRMRDMGMALMLGFGFLLFAGILGSFGHSGFIDPIAAAWIPPVIFLFLTGRLVLRDLR